MADNYTTPLARAARIMEIIIPCYMFGKSWGISDEKTVDLFRAMFPSFLVNMAEFFKGIMHTDKCQYTAIFFNVLRSDCWLHGCCYSCSDHASGAAGQKIS